MRPDAFLFESTDCDEIARFYHEYGFVAVRNLFDSAALQGLEAAYKRLLDAGALTLADNQTYPNRDIIFLDDAFRDILHFEPLHDILLGLFGSYNYELLDSRINSAPTVPDNPPGFGWHQDLSFFPHTNFDVLSFNIHMDAEDSNSAPLMLIPGSHKRGEMQHEIDGVFKSEYCGPENLDDLPFVEATLDAGTVTFHHGLTLHKTRPKTKIGERRVIIYNLRATDAIQLAGPITKSVGYQVRDCKPTNTARFPDGSRIHLRGEGGRLYDIHGRLAPDR